METSVRMLKILRSEKKLLFCDWKKISSRIMKISTPKRSKKAMGSMRPARLTGACVLEIICVMGNSVMPRSGRYG